jgi:hypothetical protein
MICRFCGSNIGDKSDMCSSCGKSSVAEATPSAQKDGANSSVIASPEVPPGKRKTIIHWMRQTSRSVLGSLVQTARNLSTTARRRWTSFISRIKRTPRRAYEATKEFLQRYYFRTRSASTRVWGEYPMGRSAVRSLLVLALSYFCWLALVPRWRLGNPDKSIVAQIPMFIGGAITSLIAISVALTLFAIQQLAQANGPTVMEEYARDKRRIFIYWILTLCALGPFLIAFFLISRLSLGLIFVQLALLYVSFELLNLHFNQAVRFSNPRYRIDLLRERGDRQIRDLWRIQNDIQRRVDRSGL